MATKYIRIKINSLVKSDQTTRRIISFDYQKTYGDAVSTCSIVLKRLAGTAGTTEDDTDFITGKHVQVWMSDSLVAGQVVENSTNIVFDGYIDDREIDLFTITLKCADRLILSKWEETGTITYSNLDITTLFQNIVNLVSSVSGITLNYSTFGNTGIVIKTYVLSNNICYEKLWELSNIANWQFYYDPSNDWVRFEPLGTPATQNFYNTSSGTAKDQNGNTQIWSLQTVNVAGNIKWSQDNKDLTNNFNLIGGQTEIVVSNESHTVTAGTLTYTLSDSKAGGKNTDTQIYNVSVIGNPGNVTLTQGVDYVVYISATPPGFIYFPVAPNTLGYTSLTFNYSYKLSASSGTSLSDATSITNYIKRTKTVTKRNVVSPTDISSYISTLLAGFKNPINEINFDSRDPIITPVIGSKVNVYDGIINRAIVATGTPIITQTIKRWPQPTTNVFISTKPAKYENQTQAYFDRIDKIDKELTATNQKPFLKLDGSVPVQGDLPFGKKVDGTPSQLLSPVIQNLSTAPTAVGVGQMYYNSTSNKMFYWNNSSWIDMTGGVISGTPTLNYLAKFTSTTTIGNSFLIDNGSNLAFKYASYAGTGANITNDINGTIIITVPVGQKIKFVAA